LSFNNKPQLLQLEHNWCEVCLFYFLRLPFLIMVFSVIFKEMFIYLGGKRKTHLLDVQL